MIQKRLLAISCFILTIFITIGCNFNGKLPKNREINLNQNSKDPYGLYIAHEEIGNLANGKIQDLEKISELKIDSIKAKNYAVVVLGDEIYFDSVTKKHLTKFAKNGGIVVMADYYDNLGDDTNSANEAFDADTIATDSTVINEEMLYNKTLIIKNDFELTSNKSFKIKKKKEVEHHYFRQITSDSEVIGTLNYEGKSYPNYLKIKPKNYNGYYLYHAEPLYFTNYYLLNEDSYFYAKSVLQQLKGRTIIWYNPNKTYASSNTSTMPFVFSQPALNSAWILLLVLLFIFLIFRSRREQRIIPIYEKEENHTVEFAKTISSLYQENGEIKDIISKKIDYFLYKIRKNFLIETDNLIDKNFIEIVSQKANYTQDEGRKIFETLNHIQHKEQPTQNDLKIVYQIIENYKLKANI